MYIVDCTRYQYVVKYNEFVRFFDDFDYQEFKELLGMNYR